MSKYITVKEFSILCKKSQQSVYKQISKGYLKPYIKVENGRTLISQEATAIYPKRQGAIEGGEKVEPQGEKLSDLGEKLGENPVEKVEKLSEKVEPQGETGEKLSEKGEKVEPIIALYKNRIEQLEKELEEAKEALKQKDAKIEEMAQNTYNLAVKLAQLTENSQVLQAREQEKKGLFSGIKRLFLPKGKKNEGSIDV